MTDPRLTYLPTAIKKLQQYISDSEWDGVSVAPHNYSQLTRWQQMVKAGVLYEPLF